MIFFFYLYLLWIWRSKPILLAVFAKIIYCTRLLEILVFRVFRNTLGIALYDIRALVTTLRDLLRRIFIILFLNHQLMDVRKHSRLWAHRTVDFKLSLIEAVIDFLPFNGTTTLEAQNMTARLPNRWSSWLSAESTYIWHFCLFSFRNIVMYTFRVFSAGIYYF